MSKRKSDQQAADAPKPKSKPGGHWSMGLVATVDDPEYFVKSDDVVNVIKDRYPKAKYHYLIMPKENVSTLKSVTPKHSSLLKHMEDVALKIINSKEHEERNFKVGYHAEASMARLHLHVISDDMTSDCVKTKKHWNSYTTDFFLKSQDVRKNLEDNGKIVLPSQEVWKKYLETPLKCHKCEVKPRNMPELKRHITTHLDE